MCLEDLEQTEELVYLKQWLEYKSKRGAHGFIDISKTSLKTSNIKT